MKDEKNVTEKTFSTDDLLKILEGVKYKSFGIPMVMLWRVVDRFHETWQCKLRNEQKWKDVEDCEGTTPKEALQQLYNYCIRKGYLQPLLNSDKNVQVSDTTEDHSSNADGVQKILSDFGKRISGEAKSKTPLTEEAFKEELEKQYPLQGMKPNRFRQQGANWSFTHYITPLLSELAAAKKEIERLKSQLDTVKKQWGIFK